ncbi:hypothetical protein Tco_0151901 [Tanacetum coccineum]
MKTKEGKVDMTKALNASLVDTKSNSTKLGEQYTSSISGNDAHADDAYIRPIYDEEPMAEDNSILSKLNSLMKEGLTRMLNNVITNILYLLH